jgi:hypothetical protein
MNRKFDAFQCKWWRGASAALGHLGMFTARAEAPRDVGLDPRDRNDSPV